MDPTRTAVLMFKASPTFRKCSGGVNHCFSCGTPCHIKLLLLDNEVRGWGCQNEQHSFCPYRI